MITPLKILLSSSGLILTNNDPLLLLIALSAGKPLLYWDEVTHIF